MNNKKIIKKKKIKTQIFWDAEKNRLAITKKKALWNAKNKNNLTLMSTSTHSLRWRLAISLNKCSTHILIHRICNYAVTATFELFFFLMLLCILFSIRSLRKKEQHSSALFTATFNSFDSSNWCREVWRSCLNHWILPHKSFHRINP